jgi:hypothetical protein
MFLQKWTRIWIFNQNNRNLGSPENSFDMLVKKPLCSVNVDKGINMQKKIHKQKHTQTQKIQQKRPPKNNK